MMIRKTTLAVVLALVAGSTSTAFASAMDNDPNTGLWSYLYYGPIADLQKQGLPISANAVKYMKEHGTGQTASQRAVGKRGNVYLLEDREGIVGTRPANAYQSNTEDKQSGHMW
jgi:hypothetical protein